MSFVRILCILALTGLGVPQARAERHALLVGVARPAQVIAAPALAGVEQDVALMTALAGDWGAAAGRRQVLAETAGGLPPTRAALTAAFDRLAGTLRNGDELLIYLSGHGTQQPVFSPESGQEEDGLDEVFLLADSLPWSPQRRAIGNALVDNELRALLEGLTGRGVFVWLVVDSCHAGTLARSGTGMDPALATGEWRAVARRRLLPEWLGIDAARRPSAPANTARLALRQRMPGLTMSTAEGDTEMPALVAFYAVEPAGDALEVELRNTRRRVGLFTYQLKTAFDALGRAGSYRELAERLLAGYRALPAAVPRPIFEGAEWQRPLWPAGAQP